MSLKTRHRDFTVEKLLELDRVSGLSVAPDGRRVVCAVSRPDLALDTTAAHLWLLCTQGGPARRLTVCGERDGQAAWSPRGDRIAFVARRGQGPDKTAQIHLISAQGGEAAACTRFAPGVQSFKWMPDGRHIVFGAWVWPELRTPAAQHRQQLLWDARKETGLATSQAFYRHWDHEIPQDRVLHLLLLDVDTGRLRDLFAGTAMELPRDSEGNDGYDVHPSGSHIAFVRDPDAQARAGNRLLLTELHLRTGEFRDLADDARWDFAAPRYSPRGERIAVTAAEVGKFHTALSEPALVQREGGWCLLAAGADLSANPGLRWTADGSAVLFAAEQRGRCHLWRCRLGAAQPEKVHEGGWVQGFDLAGHTLVIAADSAMHPARVFAVEEAQESGVPRRIESFNDPALRALRLGEVREREVTGALGEKVQVWLTFPPGFSLRRRYPVTHMIHGGPFAASGDSFSYRWNPHVVAAQGQVVVQVNYHGSSGFGHAFRHSLIGRQGELELQDIEATTDWLLAQTWVDPQRICATGGSYGGFLVAWMNGHVAAGRYGAYVCHAGVFDRVSTFSADSWALRPKDLAAEYWRDMPAVLAQSPHAFAARMGTPTLVIHGAKDFRVPDCNGLAYYNTLKARGVPARLLWFPDENHWVLKPANSRLWYQELQDWLALWTGKRSRHRRKSLPSVDGSVAHAPSL